MNFVNQTKSLKPFVFVLVAVFLFTATLGNVFAAGSGALGPVAGAEEFDPDPGVVPHFVKVANIEFKFSNDIVFANVLVLNQSNQPVAKAKVSTVWTFPDGEQMKLEGFTNSKGIASFVVEKTTGEHKLEIADVLVPDLIFNPAASQLVGTIVVPK